MEFFYMGLFCLFFGNIATIQTECKHKNTCTKYKNNSFTCTKEIDKSYCGNYRGFR